MSAVFHQVWQQFGGIIVCIDLRFFFHEVQPSFTTVAHASRYHQMWRKLFSFY